MNENSRQHDAHELERSADAVYDELEASNPGIEKSQLEKNETACQSKSFYSENSDSKVLLTVEDVVQHAPLEDEAETYIQASLEEDHRKSRSLGEGGSSISLLQSVPDEFLQLQSMGEEAPPNCQDGSESPTNTKPSTADNLALLAFQMEEMQGQSSTIQYSEDIPLTQADALVQNAAVLRNSGRDVEVGANGDERDMFAPRSSTKTNKKGRTGRGHLDVSTFCTWIKYRRSKFFRLAKIVILGFIIPGLAVAAILFYFAGNPLTLSNATSPTSPTSTPPPISPVVPKSPHSPISPLNPLNSLTPVPIETSNNTSNSNVTNTTSPSDLDIATSLNTHFQPAFVDADGISASFSWWIIFIFVRQVMMLASAILVEMFFIDFVCLRTRWAKRLIGDIGVLFLVQSSGWPFVLFCWGILNFIFLYNTVFANHWLYYQNLIGLFNASNPAGNFVNSDVYRNMLLVDLLLFGLAVAIKRFVMGLYIGRQTYSRYAEDLAKLMKKTLLVGEVARLANRIERKVFLVKGQTLDGETFTKLIDDEEDKSTDADGEIRSSTQNSDLKRQNIRREWGVIKTNSELVSMIDELLDAWEEPKIEGEDTDHADIFSIIQFRQSLTYLNSDAPFGGNFGSTESRAECIAATEKIYNILLQETPILAFDTLALIAVQADGSLDEEKLKELISVFRPDRLGNLSLLDFAKSIDNVYKELRLFRASVADNSRMGGAIESVVNIIFFLIFIIIILLTFGIHWELIWTPVFGVILFFSFAVKSACNNYFEGAMFVVVRQPYRIGDRIAVSQPTVETSSDGSPTWIVKSVSLLNTVCVLGGTSELCTYSNGALAQQRIINAARSLHAILTFVLSFPLNPPPEKLTIFKESIEKFIKARPREWVSLTVFRLAGVEVTEGRANYRICATHRESWQQSAALAASKENLFSFALEVQKQLDLVCELDLLNSTGSSERVS